VKFWRSRWLSPVVIAVGLAVGVLVLVMAYREPGGHEFWSVAFPGTLTGLGTLGLAWLTYTLIRREDADRQSTATALEQSAALVLESARQRRDARARLLQILMVDSPVTLGWLPEGGKLPEVGDHTVYQMNQDAKKTLTVRQLIQIGAVDGQPIKVMLNGITPTESNRRPEYGEFEIGSTPVGFYFDTTRTLEEWIKSYEDRANGSPGYEGRASVGVSDGFDDGVIDVYGLVQGGVPFVDNPNILGQWLVMRSPLQDGSPRFRVATRPMQRQYFISKIRNEHLAGNLDFEY
jgi:hypothetical protein